MSVYEKLFDWQKNIVNSITLPSYGLFLDMGLGKTPISLALAEKNNCNKILIITINSKVQEKKEESGSWLWWCEFLNRKFNYNIKNKINFKSKENDIYLTNYESLFKRIHSRKHSLELSNGIIEFINTCRNTNVAMIIDESHKMKDSRSLQTKAINLIKKKLLLNHNSLHCYLLSGTPFTSGYIDLYTQLKFLGYEEAKQGYIDRFCIRGRIKGLFEWQQPIIGYKNIDELYEVIHQYAITIKSEAVQKLPEQIFIEHVLPLSDEFIFLTSEKLKGRKIYDRIKKNYEIEMGDYDVPTLINNPFYRDIAFNPLSEMPTGKWYADTTGIFWMRARQISIGFNGNADDSEWYDRKRINELKKFLKENEDNYVIFYNYTPELLALYDMCDELNYNIDVYCGEIKSLNFYEKYLSQVKEERLVNNKNIILANFASGSEGKNWQAYNKCILFSIPLYKDYAQSLKRIHRTGQTETTFYHIFYQNNWLDKKMLESLKEKNNYSVKMFEDDSRKASTK